jgi:DNA polymerase-3 subunit epsilon
MGARPAVPFKYIAFTDARLFSSWPDGGILPAVKALEHIVVLDTETGGLNPLEHSLLSVGLVSGDGTRTDEFFVSEPKMVTNPRSMAVNRLDPAQVARDGLEPAETVARIEAFLDAYPGPRPVMVVGHNVAFDVAFLRRLYAMANAPFPSDFSHRTVDTHTLLWALVAQGKLPARVRGSDSAFAHFDIAPPAALRHTALGDAVATRDLVECLLELIG